jgi:tetratricopeptide (TPR) repeat protein
VAAYEHGLRLARSRGDRRWEWLFLSGLAETALLEGHWDAAEQLLADVPAEAGTVMQTLGTRCRLHAERGELAELERAVTAGESGEESDLQARSAQRLARSLLHRERGEHRQALECARESLGADLTQGNATAIAESLAAALDAAFALGDLTEVEELLRATDGLSPAQRIRALRAQAARGSARLAARQGDGEAAQTGFAEAAELFRELVSPFWLGVTLLERAEWLLGANRSDEASGSLQEAREIFGRLRATPLIDRVEAASALQPEASRA